MALASTGLLVLAAQALGAPRMDYGDAPDGADARYSIPVGAKFPSLLASNGPRHKRLGPSLGLRRDKEGDSKQVDRDRFDDGVSLDRLRACRTSTLTVLVDTRRVSPRLLRRHDLYLNTWFDWDRSGNWGQVNGCLGNPRQNNEWAIVNQRLNGKAFLRRRVRAITLRFKGGRPRGEFWMRTTLTLGQKLPINLLSRSGGASPKPYAFGETEDYLVQGSPDDPPVFDESGKERKKEPKEPGEGGQFRVGCVPNPIWIEHGKAATVRFFIRDEGKGHIFGRLLSGKRPGGNRVRIVRHSNQRGVPRGYFRGAGFRFKSRHRDARKNPIERHVVRFRFTRGKSTQILKCIVNVIHDRILKPKKPHKPQPVPPAPPAVAPQPQPQPQPQPEQQPAVKGSGTYQQSSIASVNYDMTAQFDQDVDGFRIRLKGGPPPNVTFVQSQTAGINCGKYADGSVLCAGALKANTQAQLVVQFDTEDPTDFHERLELYAIQDGKETGPFPMTFSAGATTG